MHCELLNTQIRVLVYTPRGQRIGGGGGEYSCLTAEAANLIIKETVLAEAQ